MENLFLRVLTLSLTASLVLLPLLALAPRLHHRYAGRTFYVLWLVLAVRLVLPVPLTLPNPAVTVDLPPARTVTLSGAVQAPAAVTAPAGAEGAEAPAAVGPAQPVSAETPRRPGVGWTQLGAWLWLGGMASLLVYQGAGYALARRKLLRGAEPGSEEETALLAALAAGLGVRRAPPLLHTADAASPMVLGLVRPVLLLPEGTLPAEELEVVLRHELTHLKRHDVAYQALLLLARTVHWFNPLVWWMGREAGRSLELCCDDAVVRGRDEAFCRRYGSVLLRTAAGGRMPLSTQFGGGKGQLKARLGNLFRKKRNSAALVCIALACALLCTSLVACEQAELTPEEALDALEDSIAVEGDRISFTVPEHCGPEDLWEITVSGLSETEEGVVSLHYFENEAWKAGQGYAVGMTTEVWQTVTALTLEAYPPQAYGTGTYTAARLGRTIDLLALWRTANGLPVEDIGEWNRMAADAAMDALEGSMTYDEGTVTFTLPKLDLPEELWRVQISGQAETAELGGISLHYMEDAEWTPGETYILEIPPEQWEEITQLSLDAYCTAQPDSDFLGFEGTVDLLAGYREANGIRGDALVYENEARGLTLTLPGSWKEYGACQEGEDSVIFYCAALGPETGGIAQVSFLDEPLEAVTDRDTLLGCRPGCYVYSYGYQVPLPALQQATREVRSRYNALYEDFQHRLILSFSDGLPVLPSDKPDFSFNGTTFSCGNQSWDITSRIKAATGIVSAVPVGDKIVVECHVGPKNGTYCIFDTASKSFEANLQGNHLTWYNDDITTAVYSFWSDVYAYDGRMIKSYDLAEDAYIYDLAFSEDRNALHVTIVHGDGTEEADVIDL